MPETGLQALPHDEARLDALRVLLLDCQTSGMVAAEVIEIGWQLLSEGEPCQTSLVAMTEPDSLPAKITKLTGITAEELSDAPPQAEVLATLRRTALNEPAVVVIHYAAFERRFLAELLDEPAVQAVVCSYKLAGKLWPNLPSKSLRSVSGYLGLPVTKMKRSGDHIAATAVIWQAALSRLAFEGVSTWGELTAVLAGSRKLTGAAAQGASAEGTSAQGASAQGASAQGASAQGATEQKAKKTYRLPAKVRLSLPEEPGVYHLLAAGGKLLYVGKATSLKARVNSYFRGQKTKGSRLNELVSQVAAVRYVRVGSSLEAELLEQRHIAALRPPYNVALVESAAKSLYYLDRECALVTGTETPCTDHPCFGPFIEAQTAQMLAAVLALRGADAATFGAEDLPEPLIAQAAWRQVSVAALFNGIGLFLAAVSGQGLRRIALEQWRMDKQRQAQLAQVEPTDEADEPAKPWQAEDVCGFLRSRAGSLARRGHRGRWLRRLRCADLWWTEGDRCHQLALRGDAATFGAAFDILAADIKVPATGGYRRAMPIATRHDYDRAAIVMGFIKDRLNNKPGEGLWLRCYPGRLLTAATLRRHLGLEPATLPDENQP